MWLVLALIVLVAMVADGVASGMSLQMFFNTQHNMLANIFVFGAGFVITGIVAYTPKIFSEETPFLLKVLWLIAVLVDGYTTFVVVVFYIVLHHPYSDPLNIAEIRFDPSNWLATSLALALPIILSGATMLAHYVIEKAE